MKFEEILDLMIEKNVSDAFIRSKAKLRGRINSRVEVLKETALFLLYVNIIWSNIVYTSRILYHYST